MKNDQFSGAMDDMESPAMDNHLRGGKKMFDGNVTRSVHDRIMCTNHAIFVKNPHIADMWAYEKDNVYKK